MALYSITVRLPDVELEAEDCAPACDPRTGEPDECACGMVALAPRTPPYLNLCAWARGQSFQAPSGRWVAPSVVRAHVRRALVFQSAGYGPHGSAGEKTLASAAKEAEVWR